MAFTEEQEEILKRIIEAFQNGKTINDLPDLKLSGDMYNLPIETFIFGESGRIRAGVLNDALNKDLREKSDYLDRPQISIELVGGIKIHNAEWYESNGYGLYFFRNIKATNNKATVIQGREDHEYSSCWKPKGFPDIFEYTEKRDNYIIFHTNDDGIVLKDGIEVSPEDLLDYYTVEASNGKTYLCAKWGHRGKKIDITRTRATLTFECGFAYGPVWGPNETEPMRISDMVSNFVPFKIVMYFEPITKNGNVPGWKIMFAL